MRPNYAVALVGALFLGVFYAVAQSWGSLLLVTTDLLFVFVSGLCAAFGLVLLRKIGLRGKFGMVNLGLFLAILFWFLGEVAWAVYEIVLGVEVPYPSVADVFYLIGYVPALLALLLFLRFFKDAITGLKSTISFLSGLVIIGLNYVFLLNPLTEYEVPFLEKTFDIAYPTLDAFLLIMTVTMIIVFEGSTIARSWLWVSAGFFMTALADISFAYGTLVGWYYTGHPIELLYLWGYIALALGFTELTQSFNPEGSPAL